MLRPDSRLIVLHQLGRRHGNRRAAGNHPRADTDAFREHDRAFRRALPQGAREIAVGQRQNVGHGNHVGGVAVVDDAVRAIRRRLADGVVHEVAGELARRARAACQPPDDAPAVALVVDFDDAHVVFGVEFDVAEVLARTGGDEVLAREVVRLNAHVHPFAGGGAEVGAALRDFLVLHAVGEVAAVALVPALIPAVGAHADVAFDDVQIENAHDCLSSYPDKELFLGFDFCRGIASAEATRGLSDRPLDPFGVHTTVYWLLLLQEVSRLRARPKGNENRRSLRSPFGNLRITRAWKARRVRTSAPSRTNPCRRGRCTNGSIRPTRRRRAWFSGLPDAPSAR